MNRRKFLKKTSSGVLAAAMLPLLSFTRKRNTIDDAYQSVDQFKFEDSKVRYKILVNRLNLENFNPKNESTKEINFRAMSNKHINLNYEIIKFKTISRTKRIYELTCKFNEEFSVKNGRKYMNDAFSSQLSINIEIAKKAEIKLSNGDKHLFKYDEIVPEDADCFLTSACVFHKGLPDDCNELTVLRRLRDDVMEPNPEYSKLISDYDIIAPKMLIKINAADNKDEILDIIYNNLVLPTVKYVESGKTIEGVEHYRDFVGEMKQLYL